MQVQLVREVDWFRFLYVWAQNYLSESWCNCLVLCFTAYMQPSILFRTLNTWLKLPFPIGWQQGKIISHIESKVHETISQDLQIFRLLRTDYLNLLKISSIPWHTFNTSRSKEIITWMQQDRNSNFYFWRPTNKKHEKQDSKASNPTHRRRYGTTIFFKVSTTMSKLTWTFGSPTTKWIYIRFWGILYIRVLYTGRWHNTAAQSNSRLRDIAWTLHCDCFLCLDFIHIGSIRRELHNLLMIRLRVWGFDKDALCKTKKLQWWKGAI